MFLALFLLSLTFSAHALEFQHVHSFQMKSGSIRSVMSKPRAKRQTDDKCQIQSGIFSAATKQQRIEQMKIFQDDPGNSMALAWMGSTGGVLVVMSHIELGITTSSTVYTSKNFGKDFKKRDDLQNLKVKQHNGLLRNPHDPAKVYIVSEEDDKTILYISEDSGEIFERVPLDFHLSDGIVFHSKKSNNHFLMSQEVTNPELILYSSQDNGRSWKKIGDYVDTFKWGESESDSPQTIFATFDPDKTFPLFAAFKQIIYILRKSVDGGATWTTIKENVISFGHQGKFLYASVLKDASSVKRIMLISTDGGKTWYEAQLPTLDPDMFYSVLDMQEDLVFMHVDDPGDTGHGTLYTSAGKGVIYSQSLANHLYPNYGDTTDFYRVESMRGVYLASQMNNDDSIHTVITFNRGGEWTNVPKPNGASCKEEGKACFLQIHGQYSVERGLKTLPPHSIPSAVGLVLVHAHVADTLQVTEPDVFVTEDGGYSWKKALDGPHRYQIAASGSMIVAVPLEDLPTTVKFSIDNGNCWHEYTYANSSTAIRITGLLTEPNATSLSVSIWGYHPSNRKWTTIFIDLRLILQKPCTDNDYEEWVSHSELRKNENRNVDGCLLGKKETFKRLKKDSWCFNGKDYEVSKNAETCICTREDYECDFGYYRPLGSDLCVKNTSMKILDICLQGREEEIITEGYRKIPGDECINGFHPNGKEIKLGKQCEAGSKTVIKMDETGFQKVTNTAVPPPSKQHRVIIASIVMLVLLAVVVMSIYFGYKCYLLRRHKVVYRYSSLSQQDDAGVEDALSPNSTVFNDESDDELNSPGVNKNKPNYKSAFSTTPKSNGNPFGSYHDDSDVDMLA